MNSGRMAIAATSFACMTLVSIGWSAQHGVSLSVASAQAQTEQPRVSKHIAATSHRHGQRIARGHGPVAAGADLAAGAVDTAGALAAGAIGTADALAFAATAPFGAPAVQGGYYAPSAWGDYDCNPGYAGCRPYAAKEWSKP
jgi:hypothetical protein